MAKGKTKGDKELEKKLAQSDGTLSAAWSRFRKASNKGRPALYETADDLSNAIGEYFKYCDNNNQVPTIHGMATFLGYSDRNSIDDQAKRGEDFSGVIKGAKSVMAQLRESALYTDQSVAGHIFWLKAVSGMSDQSDTNINFGGYSINIGPPKTSDNVEEVE